MPTTSDDLRLYSLDDVASRLACSKLSIKRAIDRGEIHPTKTGRTYKISAEELRRLVTVGFGSRSS
jgi:excisionase family DNA binding protein